MKQHLKWVLSLAGVVALVVACQQAMGPTETATSGQGPSDGQARAMVTPSPVVSVVPGGGIPGGGIPNPAPGCPTCPFPKPTDIGVSTTSIASTTTTSTSTTSSTTTSTTFPPGCPATLQVDASDTPVPGGSTVTQSRIDIFGLDPLCRVQSVEVTFRVTGNLSTSDQNLSAQLIALDSDTADIFRDTNLTVGTSPPIPLSGTDIGSTCTTLTFRNGGGDFTVADPPYNGIFRPVDNRPGKPGQNSFTIFQGVPINQLWILSLGFDGDPLAIECFRIRFTLARLPG